MFPREETDVLRSVKRQLTSPLTKEKEQVLVCYIPENSPLLPPAGFFIEIILFLSSNYF